MKHLVMSLADMQQQSTLLRNELFGAALCRMLMSLLAIDRVNELYARCKNVGGCGFAQAVLDDLQITLNVEMEEGAKRFLERQQSLSPSQQTAFITVSNHPFGALDGIALLAVVGQMFQNFRLFANAMLMRIETMQPCFIPVNPSEDLQNDSLNRSAMAVAWRHVSAGGVLGVFPAGSVSSIRWNRRIEDAAWHVPLVKLIRRMEVPVLPIYFEGRNTLFFHFLGLINWRLRSLRLPYEVFRKQSKTLRLVVREPIYPHSLRRFEDPDLLSAFLRNCCYGR